MSIASSAQIQAEYIGKPYEVVNSTGTGATVLITCSALGETIPVGGALISNFSDQQEPIRVTPTQVADANVCPNGQLVTWTTPNYVDISFSTPANSLDDFLMTAIETACRKRAGLTSPGTPPPIFTLAVVFPNALGQSRIFSNCVLLNGDLNSSMGTNSRINSKSWTFRGIGMDASEGSGGFNIG